jgi:excinuclease ABC subunit A
MASQDIIIKGAREHNLQGVNLTLKRNQLICLTGVSGSGKSSLAFDTLYAEGQRRYVESLSSYARQFLGQLPKPNVEIISGLAPCIAIEQKVAGRNPRSTVGTLTEVYDYLRVLYARVGQGYCYVSGLPIRAQTVDQIIESISKLPEGTRYQILAPIVQNQKGEFRDLFEDLLKKGFLRARVDGEVYNLSEPPLLKKHFKHNIEVVVDRLVAGKGVRNRLAEAIENAIRLTDGMLLVVTESPAAEALAQPVAPGDEEDAQVEIPLPAGRKKRGTAANATIEDEESSSLSPKLQALSPTTERLYSTKYACPESGMSYEPPSPQLFSFNSPIGMCPDCQGLGVRTEFLPELLVTDETKSIQKGAIDLLGVWKDIGKWRRHIYDGGATAIETDLGLKAGTVLKEAWKDVPKKAQDLFLYGTGSRHVTFSWRTRGGIWKHGGPYEGIIPELNKAYGSAKNPMRRRQLEKYMSTGLCSSCQGSRLNKQAQNVRLTTMDQGFIQTHGKSQLSLPEICALSTFDAWQFFGSLELDHSGHMIAEEALKEIRGRLGFLLNCGLDYLTLDRSAPTLSGGEAQRIRLAGQIGCGLVGVVYILDEPSIGLHPRDNTMLLRSLQQLRDQGNTVIVVEHDEETMENADYLVDFGPGPGVRGGYIVAEGTPAEVKANPKSLTGKFLSGVEKIEVPAERRGDSDLHLEIKGATHHNLKNVDVKIPLGRFVCVTGVSGSGKSSLINDILWPVLNRELNKGEGNPGAHKSIAGLEHLDKAIDIDQSPIGRTPRSNPATYVKVFDLIRDLYTQLPASKLRGYPPGRFSFNVDGGRCEHCEGHGATKLEMDFLADVWVTCPVCGGHRFNHETLEIKFKEKSIAEVLEMDIQQALEHFENVPKIRKLVQTLHDVGLDYLKLGQPSPTLSGGEAQRIKLARELGKRSTGKTIYLLDEPTTGLHFADVKKLLEVLHNFVEQGNTVLVVEHNLDVIKTADWVIDIGPEGGAGGGTIVAEGTPEEIASSEISHTGRALRAVLPGAQTFLSVTNSKKKGKKTPTGMSVPLKSLARATKPETSEPASARWNLGETQAYDPSVITIRGAKQHNLQNLDLTIPREKMSVFCGPSGSGKSSLAMDTLYAEGQRRYVESLSSYARQFLGQMPKPVVEHIHGLSPAIAIEQKTVGNSPRSTVGTVTEIYDYLRILYTRLGTMYCPDCDLPVIQHTTDEIVDRILEDCDGKKILVLAPISKAHQQDAEKLFPRLKEQGFQRVRLNGKTYQIDELPKLDRKAKTKLEIVVDRLSVTRAIRGRLNESLEVALEYAEGEACVAVADDKLAEEKWTVHRYSRHLSCHNCGRGFETLVPQNFSFNSPLGWCPSCQGIGTQEGTSQAALIGDQERSLADGAIIAWPMMKPGMLFTRMTQVMAADLGIPLDVPFRELTPTQQRVLLYGDEQQWFQLPEFSFQYKGLYPAIYEASRVSFVWRQKLAEMIGQQTCSSCHGARIREEAAAVRFDGLTMAQLTQLPLEKTLGKFQALKMNKEQKKIAGELMDEVKGRLKFLVQVGLEYLTLDRGMPTLSGGESQRIRLAGQLGRSLTGVLYVLDEPTIGLHPRDNHKLIGALNQLRDIGNTVILVEHDQDILTAADQLYDFGPGSGRYGGSIVTQGTPKEVTKDKTSLTGNYLAGREQIPVPTNRRMGSVLSQSELEAVSETKAKKKSRKTQTGMSVPGGEKATSGVSIFETSTLRPDQLPVTPKGAWLELIGARHNNLRNVDLRIPLGTLTCITGVSGSGKSSLIQDTLATGIQRRLRQLSEGYGAFDELKGLGSIDKLIVVDQKPLGTTPASNPATYVGLFDEIRELFSILPEAKMRGFKPGRFSFNRPGGRCEDCEGMGQKCIEMHFLPDVWIECSTCRGKRYNQETLAIRFQGRSISDVLNMPISEALKLFDSIPKLRAPLKILDEIGLGYLTLGQSAATLSGGEAQRIKLAAELSRSNYGKTIYLLDEPTTGLHINDISKLLKVLNSLVDLGNTVVVIEHNLDVVKTADWVVDVGPEAGAGGGYIVAQGTPEDLVQYAHEYAADPKGHHRSYTADLLTPFIEKGTREEAESLDLKAITKKRSEDRDFRDIAKEQKSPWQVDGRKWHTQDRLSYNSKSVHWDGSALEFVVDLLSEYEELAETNWNHQSVVEVKSHGKEGTWFLHAHTAHEWLLKLYFRVKKGTYTTEQLVKKFPWETLNDIEEIQAYSGEPRVQVPSRKGPWQEVLFAVYKKEEIDTPEFRKFLDEMVKNYLAENDQQMQGSELERVKQDLKKKVSRKVKAAE